MKKHTLNIIIAGALYLFAISANAQMMVESRDSVMVHSTKRVRDLF